MINNRDFLVLSDDWNGVPSSPKHLFRQIARHNRVFWFNVINRAPQLTYGDLGRVATTLRRWCGLARRIQPEANGNEIRVGGTGCCYSVTPFLIPWFKSVIRQINRASLLRHFRQICRQYQIREPIVVTQWPSTADFVEAVPAALKVYYCVDDWLHYPGFNARDMAVMERKLIGCVDAFVATSRDLEKKGTTCPASRYLPHGVDFDHFQQAAQAREPVRDLQDLPRPIVGFFGCLDQWVDVNLIATLGRQFPDASFVLLGRQNVPLDGLSDCSNVRYLGMVPYADLPRYAAYFDIGLIPFVRNTLTEAVNPLKVMEYYALGLPVLATRLPELEAIGGPIRLASTAAEFCANLREIIDGRGPDGRTGIEIARQSTWQRRADELCDFLATAERRTA